ncbi:LOW QUALITY PROTEIN: copper resistance protein copC [Brevundimonas abyssalis TAR-001]|uniref:Copper resistance protein copC n=1 Tax=Brevundimonas abyssalis TAR-001 TaxID=1391729 RepID=A0A8E0NB54_9CAUL|nr:LOW QUALITY PROTEIN: copper resistance protein copC [Brevundimonas abyssalis TAR-001]
MTPRKILSLVGAASALLLVATQAEAHARVVSSTPAATATIASPRALTVTFSERVVPAFSGLEVVNAAGAKFAVTTTVSEDARPSQGGTARPLAAGAYNLNWRAASADGHRMTGVIVFTVR